MVRAPQRQSQRGGVALEAALVLPAMLLLLWGVVTFGAIFYTQLALTRAAEDGAITANLLRTSFGEDNAISPEDRERIEDEIINSLAASLIAPRDSNDSIEARRVWLNNLRDRILLDTSSGCGEPCLRIRIAFPYDNEAGTRILPDIDLPLVGQLSWLPETLVGEATILL